MVPSGVRASRVQRLACAQLVRQHVPGGLDGLAMRFGQGREIQTPAVDEEVVAVSNVEVIALHVHADCRFPASAFSRNRPACTSLRSIRSGIVGSIVPIGL